MGIFRDTELEKIEKNRCQFNNCKNKACSIMRGKYLCLKHFEIIKSDNKLRISLKKEIPKDLNILDTTEFSFRFSLNGK